MRKRPARSPPRHPFAARPALGVPIAPVARAPSTVDTLKEWALRVADVLVMCIIIGGLALTFTSDPDKSDPPPPSVSWQWKPFGKLPWPS